MDMFGGDTLFDQTRGLVLALGAAIGVDQGVEVVAQAVPSLNDAFLMQLAEKGGGWVVLLIVLFFYRRDYQRLTVSDRETRQELLQAVTKQSESEKRLAAALVRNTEVVRALIASQQGHSYEPATPRDLLKDDDL